jgi:O-antigen ligase
VVFAVAVVPLAYLPSPAGDAWSDLFRRGVLGAGIAIAVAAALLAGGGPALRASPLLRPLVLLLAVHVAAAAASAVPLVGALETVRVMLLGALALLASAGAGASSQGVARAGLLSLLVALIAVGLPGLLGLIATDVRGAAYGTLENRNDLGTIAAAGVAAGLYLARARVGDVALALLAAGGHALSAARTRGALIAAALAGGAALVFGRGAARGRERAVAVAAAAGLVLVAALVFLRPVTALGESAASRLVFWRAALDLFAERPLLGHGPGSYRVEIGRFAGDGARLIALDAHQDFLQTLAETGLAGGVALVWLIAVALRAARAGDHERAWAFALAAVLLHSLTHMVLRVTAPSALAFVALGLAAPAAAAGTARVSTRWRVAIAGGGAIALGVALAPALAALSVRRAEVAERAGDRGEVMVWAARAVRFHPALPEAWDMLARARLLARDPDGALRAAAGGLRVAPHEADLHLRAGAARLMAGDRAGAARDLAAARRLAPGSPEVRRWLDRLDAGSGGAAPEGEAPE